MSLRLAALSRIGDRAPHNAFTSLAKYDDMWFCVYREGSGHVSHDGAVRVLSSSVARSATNAVWSESATLTSPDPERPDLRDPKICHLPSGGLAIVAGATVRGDNASCQSFLWTSSDGGVWSDPHPIGDTDVWLWGLTTDDAHVYASGYAFSGAGDENDGVTLWRADGDAGQFTRISSVITGPSHPNETALLATPKSMVALVRRRHDAQRLGAPSPGTTVLCTAEYPYDEWRQHDVGFFIGGPALCCLPDGRVIAGGRKMTPESHTTLWQIDFETGHTDELITLPSAGDSSYPGIVWHDNALWISYYSSHEGKTSVYFAELREN